MERHVGLFLFRRMGEPLVCWSSLSISLRTVKGESYQQHWLYEEEWWPLTLGEELQIGLDPSVRQWVEHPQNFHQVVFKYPSILSTCCGVGVLSATGCCRHQQFHSAAVAIAVKKIHLPNGGDLLV